MKRTEKRASGTAVSAELGPKARRRSYQSLARISLLEGVAAPHKAAGDMPREKERLQAALKRLKDEEQ